MIDISHPDSEFIFRAGAFTDRIKNYCRKYILESFEERKITFQDMKIEALLLLEFSELHFKENLNSISKSVNDLNVEIDKLEAINISSEDGNCTVCNTKLETFDTLIKEKDFRFITICKKCPNEIYNILNTIDWATGAAFI
ncbi:hypothetical protein [Chryseobacterium sp. MMS23-Vi53]|uniref:hypothetical protein n=1 Tax=Chryseobacterium sp. MMS23-Vi53 TaxID=3386644 RepID=UPI0039EA0E6D